MDDAINTILDEFSQRQKFSDALFAEVFKKVVKDYPHESQRQTLIRAMINIYEAKYKPEMRRHEKNIQRKRETALNEFAANKEEDIRNAISLPDTLFTRLNDAIELFNEKPLLNLTNPPTEEEIQEWDWFIKEFPQYVVPNKN